MGDREPSAASARIDLANEPEFELGGMRVKPAERSVELNGDRRDLQPRVMQVLIALAKARPAVVSRDRLIEQCWDGRIVGDDALNRCILALRHLAEEAEPHGFTIETVPRIGHRLVERGAAEAASAGPTRRVPNLRLAGALLALLLAAAAVVFWQQRSAQPEPASIAVLPFRNLSAGDPYFAEGVGEEILAQLSREPGFRIAGSASSSQIPKELDLRQVGRRLDVEFLLEGSVRRQGDRVRVSADLVRVSDGFRLWADTYDGKLDDIFAIQQRVGSAIAAALKQRLVRAPVLTGPLVTRGEAYSLYLSARTLIRTNNRRMGPTAVALLRDAIRLDPGYAPAWAGLADATRMAGALNSFEGAIRSMPQARAYAAKAVQLAPDLGEAHRALANTYERGDPRRSAHFRRAAELDPNSAESLHGLAEALQSDGRFEQAFAVYRRAQKLEPLWYRTVGQVGITLAEMGNRAQAEAVARAGFPGNEIQQHILLGRIAWIVGDFSEAARRWSIVARSDSPRWQHTAQRTLYDAARAVGVEAGTLELVPKHWRYWMDEAPSPAEWRARNRDPLSAEIYGDYNLIAAKLMLNAGRARELVAAYDSATGLLGLGKGARPRVDQAFRAPTVALALREAGRTEEASRLLDQMDRLIRRTHRSGKVPFRFDAAAAETFAAEGRRDEAVAALERAFARGWRHVDAADLRDISDEPALRSLHGHPGFERLRARLADHVAKEREEVIRLQI